MSALTMGKVWNLELTLPKRIVLLAMADHADHEGCNIYPCMGLIAWKTGYSERHTKRIVKDLVEDGILIKQKERAGDTTIYRIDFSAGTQKPSYRVSTHDTVMSPQEGHPDVMGGG